MVELKPYSSLIKAFAKASYFALMAPVWCLNISPSNICPVRQVGYLWQLRQGLEHRNVCLFKDTKKGNFVHFFSAPILILMCDVRRYS